MPLPSPRRFLQGLPLPAALRRGSHPAAERRAAEASQALTRSEGELTAVESKGQMLTSISAIVAAAVGLAISLTWSTSTTPAKWLLVGAATYDLKSLWAPLALTGPVQRACPFPITTKAGRAKPAAHPPEHKLQAANLNRLTALRLSSLLATSRRDLLKAILLFTAWATLALTGLATNTQPGIGGVRDFHRPHCVSEQRKQHSLPNAASPSQRPEAPPPTAEGSRVTAPLTLSALRYRGQMLSLKGREAGALGGGLRRRCDRNATVGGWTPYHRAHDPQTDGTRRHRG